VHVGVMHDGERKVASHAENIRFAARRASFFLRRWKNEKKSERAAEMDMCLQHVSRFGRGYWIGNLVGEWRDG
jgi:hypothetical protein